jgi:hypothetical protein
MLDIYVNGIFFGVMLIFGIIYWLDRLGILGYVSWINSHSKKGLLKGGNNLSDIRGKLVDLRCVWPRVQFFIGVLAFIAFPLDPSGRVELFLACNLLLEVWNMHRTVLSISYLFYIGTFTIYWHLLPGFFPYPVVFVLIVLAIFIGWWIGRNVRLAGGFAVQP